MSKKQIKSRPLAVLRLSDADIQTIANRIGATSKNTAGVGTDATSGALLGSTQVEAVSQTPLDEIGRHLGNASALADRVIGVVARMIGSSGGGDASGGAEPKRDGVLHDVAAFARRTGANVELAHEALSRLEAHL